MKLSTALAPASVFLALLAPASAHPSPQSFQGLGDLPGGAVQSEALGISGDGLTVVGNSESASGVREAFRWTAATGMVGLGDLAGGVFESSAVATSFDGSVVVGSSSVALPVMSLGGSEAFRWEAGSMTGLGDLGGSPFNSFASDISDDGSVIVGGARSLIGAGGEAFRWTAPSGMVGLGTFVPTPGPWSTSSFATTCSADGSVVFGYDSWFPEVGPFWFRWTNATGFQLNEWSQDSRVNVSAVSSDGSLAVGFTTLITSIEGHRLSESAGLIPIGDLPGAFVDSRLNDVSGNGEVSVGAGTTAAGSAAIVWDPLNGLRDLQQLLTNTFGLNLAGWQLTSAESISRDGTAICGIGINPAGNTEAWLAVIPPTIVPLSICSGDGGDQMGCTDCPCGNNSEPGGGVGCLNSLGRGARLNRFGDTSVSLPSQSTSDLRFSASGGPSNQLFLLNSGNALAPASPANPCFGLGTGAGGTAFDGLRCAVLGTLRHGGRPSDFNGEVGVNSPGWGGEFNPVGGIAQASGFAAGTTKFFQCIYRDSPAVNCGTGLNTTQAIEILWTP